MNLTVNGEARETHAAIVAELVEEITGSTTGSGIAVAIGDEVLPRSEWDRALRENQKIEILTAVQGG